jgi:hypothetical protein
VLGGSVTRKKKKNCGTDMTIGGRVVGTRIYQQNFDVKNPGK